MGTKRERSFPMDASVDAGVDAGYGMDTDVRERMQGSWAWCLAANITLCVCEMLLVPARPLIAMCEIIHGVASSFVFNFCVVGFYVCPRSHTVAQDWET